MHQGTYCSTPMRFKGLQHASITAKQQMHFRSTLGRFVCYTPTDHGLSASQPRTRLNLNCIFGKGSEQMDWAQAWSWYPGCQGPQSQASHRPRRVARAAGSEQRPWGSLQREEWKREIREPHPQPRSTSRPSQRLGRSVLMTNGPRGRELLGLVFFFLLSISLLSLLCH